MTYSFTGFDRRSPYDPFEHLFVTTETADEVKTLIRVTFNRNFTWSERETFRNEFINDYIKNVGVTHKWLNKNVVQLEVNGAVDLSRALSEDVSNFVEHSYLNIHPKAVRTLSPQVHV